MCGTVHSGCKSCAREDEENRRRIARDLELERERHERQRKYAQSLQELDDEIDHQRRLMKYSAEEQEEAQALKQKTEQLQSLKRASARLAEVKKRELQNKATSPAPKKQKPNEKESQSTWSGLTGAKAEWESAKANGAANAALDKLMDLIGLESIKDEFLSIQASIDAKIRQGVSLSEERFSCSLLGNPGTGKTTVARLWGAFLTSTGAIPGDVFKETTGSKLASQGVPGCEKMIEDIKDDGGGVLFIDEAYQLSSGNSPGGKAVLDYLLAEVENLRGKVVFVLAGYDKEMESFFSHNPGLPSRFPITLKFGDYTDDELLRIFQLQIHKKFKGRMQLEDGDDGLYARIVARRIGRGRGRPGFGNARAVENAIDRILKSQAKHIRKAKRAGTEIDELSLTKLDLIGPEPTKALDNCPAWKELNQMIGLVKVKEELKAFRDTVITNYHRELEEEPSIDFSLNRVFMGPPGTGKTTVAKLYGQILAHLGLLSNGEVVIKNPSDFVGAALGQSEAQTKGILASTVGKVLVIDEAYGLYGGDGVADPYKTAVIDTIVAEVQSVPGDDRCVLLLGYDDQMQEMFQKVNPGLSRRFPMSSGFQFEDFDDDALSQIFDLKLKQSAFKVSGEAKGAALEVLRRARNRPNFGNAGEIDILLDRAKASQQKRSSLGQARRGVLDAVDFDSDFDRATRDTDVRALFKGDVGREKVITLLEGFQQRVRELKSLDMDPKEEIPFSFLFRGPPGTGKTTTAKKMGKVYYDMGFLSTAEVIECSASEMIGQYVGQTGPKVQQLMEKALGKVLFIDEAYRLADGGFAKEAVDELVDCVTKPKYQGRLIIILAGYVNDMNRLLSINPGMSSRFPETIDFEALSSEDCFQLLRNELQRKKKEMQHKGKTLDITSLEAPSERFKQSALRLFRQLRDIEGWASGRDVKQIAKNVFKSVKLTAEMPTVSEESVEGELCKFLAERSERAAAQHGLAPPLQAMSQIPPTLNGPSMTTETLTTTESALEEVEVLEEEFAGNGPDDHSSGSRRVVVRDASVSDEVWEQLEKDKAAEAQREANYQKLKEAAKKAKDGARAAIVKQLLEEEDRRKKEQAMKKKLAMMGRCPVGYEWIKQDGGYRCAGGSHWMSDGDIEKAG
jgi:replication-associated recombination protein RarA